MRSARGITFETRPPVVLIRLLTAVAIAGAGAPLLTAWPWYLRGGLGLVLAAHAALSLRRLVRCPLAVAEWASDGLWGVIDRHGEAFPAELEGFRVVGTWVLLRLRWHDARAAVFLCKANTHPDDLRILRVRLAGRSGATLP
ncbi:hypothetical protein P3W33_08685 [Luteibacter sp. PPL552]